MSGEEKRKHKRRRGSVISVIFIAAVSLGLAATEGFLGEPEWILVVGVPQHHQAEWSEFLQQSGIRHRFDPRGRAVYVYQDPIPILEEAVSSEALGISAKRSLLERELEAEFRTRWEEARDPRICLAFPDSVMGDTEGGQPISIVYVEGLSGESIDQVKGLMSARVEGLTAKNVVVIGTNWRPWPGYVSSGRGAQVARDHHEKRER